MKYPKKIKSPPGPGTVQSAPRKAAGPTAFHDTRPADYRLFDALREGIPIIDASIQKIIRLVGGLNLSCPDKKAERMLNRFLLEVPVGGVSRGLDSFLSGYLDDMLTYGSAVGEIVLDRSGRRVAGLYNGRLEDIEIHTDKNPLQSEIWIRENNFAARPASHPERILFTALNPKSGEAIGRSILQGLPFVSNILLRIYESIGQNFERIGNIRYAVTYRPQGNETERGFAKERAEQIASAWSKGMNAAKEGRISDFVSVGDVDIKVIGADNQLIDTQIPVRQMLEQIVAKLGVPPFLLGLSWSTTERMSKQQADILTSELSYYRRLLNPIVQKICETYLRLEGFSCTPSLSWNVINLQDEGEMAKARLNNAQADQIYRELEESDD